MAEITKARTIALAIAVGLGKFKQSGLSSARIFNPLIPKGILNIDPKISQVFRRYLGWFY